MYHSKYYLWFCFRVTNAGAKVVTIITEKDIDYEEGEVPDDIKLSQVELSIHLKRLPIYYLLNIIVPTIVLAFLSAFVFYVPVDSGEKLSLSITILLSFSVFLLILSDNTPNISQDLPFLGKEV